MSLFAKIFFSVFFLFETVIEKSDIQRFISNYIQIKGKYSKENFIIEYNSIPDKITVKEQNVSLNISDRESMTLRGNITIPLDILADGKIVKRTYISAKIRTFDSIFVTTKQIKQNEILTAENIEKKWLETTYLYQQEVKNLSECLGKKVIKYVSSGQPLSLNFIENLPIISKGKSVRIRAKVNSVCISAQGIAKQDGKLGDIIIVENSSNGSKLRGIVKDENTVEIIR